MKKNILSDFLFCGLVGWCMECFWTGLHQVIKHKDPRFVCNTSVWMFPIYGLAALISPISKLMKRRSALFRGGVYTFFIFATEFTTGEFLKKRGACPWDYSKAKLNLDGVIRLDYAPVWFFVGLLYEKILKKEHYI